MKNKESPYPQSTFNYKPVQRAKNELDRLRIEEMNNKSQFNKYKELREAWEKYIQLNKELIEKW